MLALHADEQVMLRHWHAVLLIRRDKLWTPQRARHQSERAAGVHHDVAIVDQMQFKCPKPDHANSHASKRLTSAARSSGGRKAARAALSVCCFTSSSVSGECAITC